MRSQSRIDATVTPVKPCVEPGRTVALTAPAPTVGPFDTGSYPATGFFTMLGFPDPGNQDIVYRDGITDAIYLKEESDVRAYARAFDIMRPPQRVLSVPPKWSGPH